MPKLSNRIVSLQEGILESKAKEILIISSFQNFSHELPLSLTFSTVTSNLQVKPKIKMKEKKSTKKK